MGLYGGAKGVFKLIFNIRGTKKIGEVEMEFNGYPSKNQASKACGHKVNRIERITSEKSEQGENDDA